MQIGEVPLSLVSNTNASDAMGASFYRANAMYHTSTNTLFTGKETCILTVFRNHISVSAIGSDCNFFEIDFIIVVIIYIQPNTLY